MYKVPESGETLTGNDRFIGFCKDLADKIADKLGIQCKLSIYIMRTPKAIKNCTDIVTIML